MDANQFLAEFGHIANAPGGVSNLRRMVSSLAVQGKLSQFSASDTPVKNTLDSLENRRQEVLKEQDLTSTKKHRNLGKAKIGFTVPPHWSWEFLAYVSSWPLKDGDWVESKDQNPNGGVRLIQLADVGVGEYKNKSARFLTESKAKELNCYFLNSGDVLIARLPDPLGRACIFPGDTKPCVTVVDVAVCRAEDKYINPQYLVHCINSAEIQRQIEDLATGTTRKRVATGKLGTLSVPIPPIEEQSRIVAKVDELMALCDQLEAQQQQRRTLQNHLRQATLQAVAASQSPHELQDSWQRLQTHFGQLFSAPEDVVAFKGLILDLAVTGNLSDIEYRHHSTGAALIEAIAERRIAWSHEAKDQEKKEAQTMLKKLRTQQINVPETSLPGHWTWASLLQVSQVTIDCDHKTPTYADNGIHLIRTTDIRDGKMLLGATKKVSHESYLLRSRRLTPQPDDIFFTREAPMGEAAVVPTDQVVCLGQRLMLIRLFTDLFNEKFLIYVIRSPGFQRRIQEAAVGMTVKHINVRDVETLMLPVPPKPEQDAIVTIIDALFAICDRFEKQLSKKQRVAENLVSSSVASLTGIAIEQEEELMKAPQTELVAPVRLGTPPDVKAQAPLATILARHNGELSAKDLWQRFGGEIDVFYAQLKTEVAHGWITEPAVAEMREKQEITAGA